MKSNSKITALPRGFSMIEMMAVVAVIAILGSLALPSVYGRIIRQQIEASYPLADVAKKNIAASWANTQLLPADNTAALLPAADKMVNNYVSALSVTDGVINITFGNSAHSAIKGKVLTMRPAVIEDAQVVPVAWVCAKALGPDKMVVKGSDQTTIPDTYLPLECRLINRNP